MISAFSGGRLAGKLRSRISAEGSEDRPSGLLVDVALLVTIGILSYGLLIPWLGYYWDDWRILWIGSGHLSTDLIENYGYRPGTAWLFYALQRFVGTHFHLAQCLALALRLANALAFWRIVRLAWPNSSTLAFASSALFLVYPGFTQQSISLTYQNYHICMLCFLLSLLLMLRGLLAERFSSRCLLILASLVLEIGYLLLIDGMISWEAMRWALILVLALRHAGSIWDALVSSVVKALPYALTAVAFVLWRGFFVKASRVDVDFSTILNNWRKLSFGTLATRVPGDIVRNIMDSSIFAWVTPAQEGANFDDKALLAGLGIAILGAALAFLWLRRWSTAEGPNSWFREFILVGGISLLTTSMLQCFVMKNIRLNDETDRFAYASSLGVVFLVLGLSRLGIGRRAMPYFTTFLIALSILSDFSHSYMYKRFWDMERSLNWQLSWRAPDIAPGTLVVIARPRLGFWLDDFQVYHDIHAVLNLHYTDSETPLIGLPPIDEASEFAAALLKGQREQILKHVLLNIVRNVDYVTPGPVQEPPGVLLFYLSYPRGTLRTVDIDHLDELPQLPPALATMVRTARVGLIRGSGPLGVPTSQLLGKEPAHTWTWFFQRAELARQLDDRAELGRLVAEVYRRRMAPGDPSEFLVFLEAAIRTNHEDGAAWIVQELRDRHRPFIPKLKTWLEALRSRGTGSEPGMAAAFLEKLD